MGEQPLSLISLSRVEVAELYRATGRGDQEAAAALRELLAGATECVLCAAPLADGEGFATFLPDPPASKQGRILAGRLCLSCYSLPLQVRLRQITKMAQALWPGWHPARPSWRERQKW